MMIYSPEQMKRLTKDLHAPDYACEIGGIRARRNSRRVAIFDRAAGRFAVDFIRTRAGIALPAFSVLP
jgi:hypothetical protein